MKLTVDASVVVKWFVQEPFFEEARLLLAHRLTLYAPDMLLAEFANTIWKKARQNEISDTQPYLDKIQSLDEIVSLYPISTLIARAAEVAQELDHPVYDCLYLACAEATESVLVTADHKFAKKVTTGFVSDPVRYIGSAGFADEIGAAATALVIGRDKIQELIAAYNLLADTEKHIFDTVHAETRGLKFIADEIWKLCEDSPAYRRLYRLVEGLNNEERIDLLALGYLGFGHFDANWRRNFEHACEMIDLIELHYIVGHAITWQAGLDRLTDSCAE
ncbi:MAG: PIN domain-containing protein [Desulfurellaceae bacterium]|nr:PIN domain-containing protein [Desulfurellaceae bacterium]